jgi:uncharacterized protein (UPF0333 family)
MRGQTAIEYIMLIGAVVMLVVIVFIMVKGNVFGPAAGTIDNVTKSIWDGLRGVVK